MPFEITLDHFRIFENTGRVKVRPITLLTGGNSAGKSSFLAGLRYLSDIGPLRNIIGSFNKDPFYLGSYDQIAHFRGGKPGRSKSFYLSYGSSYQSPSKRTTTASSIRLTFAKRLTQPTLQRFEFDGGRIAFDFQVSQDWKSIRSVIRSDDQRLSRTVDISEVASLETISRNPGFIAFLVDTIFRDDEKSVDKSDERRRVSEVSSILRDFINSIPRTYYAGAPVRSRPSRTYDPIDVSPQAEGTHVPSQLAQLARSSSSEWANIKRHLVKFGQDSALFTDFEVRSLGRSDSDPFQLNVIINGPKRNIVDVGYGISQTIPIIFETVRRQSGSIVIVQQPEVHLHPEAQASLGSFFVENIERRQVIA